MTDVSEHYLLLQADADQLSSSQLLSRPVGLRLGAADVLAALDASGHRHLLIPVAVDTIEGDSASQGVTLGQRILRVGADDVTYADLHCRMPTLDSVFERLVDDTLTRLTSDSSSPLTTCRNVLDQWRALLRAAGASLSREELTGLVGELEVLRLLALHDAPAALDAWRGPSRSVHDFVRGGSELEVKTSTSVDGNFVSISNIDQLDPGLSETLHLIVVHAREDATAANLDDRIDELVGLGVPRDALLLKVADAGYAYGSDIQIEDRFRIRSVRAWVVGDTFPGLRRAELGEARLRGVSRIRYELTLDAAPRRIQDADLGNVLATWLGTK